MKRTILTFTILLAVFPSWAEERVPGERWLRYENPAQAGFDPARLDQAKETWKELPSSALMVIADGAVVANWGETERRFMCHSVRKSFLSALFGIYWDRGDIQLNKTLAELGIDEDGEGLLESEKQARILDLLKARSGIFHPAAYAGRTDSQARGSQGPGRYFAYNNWDFNTLATILEKETGDTVFEAFDQHFGKPLQMEDWRVSDGYFHYERDKSVYPAYPFRLSARDAARFGLLFARDGRWGDPQILSRHWVRRSTALYSGDDDVMGYGMMWWVAREPRFAEYGFVAALGVGNQMIAVLPDLDLVIVNRANTYRGERTPRTDLLNLVEMLLKARVGEPHENPQLRPMATPAPPPYLVNAITDARFTELATELVGEWSYPPELLGMPERTRVKITANEDHLVTYAPTSGTFVHYLQPDGWLMEEDSQERFLPIRDKQGAITGIADLTTIARGAIIKASQGQQKEANHQLGLLASETGESMEAARILVQMFKSPKRADKATKRWKQTADHQEIQSAFTNFGYSFLRRQPQISERIFTVLTHHFPETSNSWETLGEAHKAQGHLDKAIEHFAKAHALDPENTYAARILKELRQEKASKQE